MFRPTLEEFKNLLFTEYIEKADKKVGPEIGCYKVKITILQLLIKVSYVNDCRLLRQMAGRPGRQTIRTASKG